jgi:hypothetical protein
MFNHAMLGGEFTPSLGNGWRAIVPISLPDGRIVPDSLVGNAPGEHVRAGLPEEFFTGLELAVRDLEQTNGLLAGVLTIRRAAHSNIAANALSFRQAMHCLIRILQTEPNDLTDELLKTMLQLPRFPGEV